MKLKKFIENYFPRTDFDSFEKIKLSGKLVLPSVDDLKQLDAFKDLKFKDLNVVLSWPPNVFLILYSLLDYTDKYRLIVSPQKHFVWKSDDNEIVSLLSNEWLSLIEQQFESTNTNGNHSRFNLVSNLDTVFNKNNFNVCIYDLLNRQEFITSVFHLLLSVDELFSDINICDITIENKLHLLLFIRNLVYKTNHHLTDSDKKHGFVTFKANVPQSGLTINNLTQNLACIKPSVMPQIIVNKQVKKSFDKKSYNILFLPWPLEIDPSSFVESKNNSHLEMNEYFGFFDYKPNKELKSQDFLNALISAVKRVGTVDLIVLPECSLSEKTFEKFQNILFECFGENAPSLLAGIYSDNNNKAKNAAKLAFIGETKEFDSFEQQKHHRWFLDKNQLRNYNLSSTLDPGKKWWENIEVCRRRLLTLHTKDGVKLCPLICEDLARQEPVAQAVRAVGPNLVVCLLLDGPQISERWPGKYAAVLSDDPGASVLSVTPLGMTLNSTGLGHDPSRDVALWSEPNKGAESLRLGADGVGIVIELKMVDEEMWTMDGRCKMKPVLRKTIHTTVKSEYDGSNTSSLSTRLKTILKKGGV